MAWTDGLTPEQYRALEVERSEYQAIGYVWGRQDKGEPGDTLRSLDFGKAYAARKLAFMKEETCFLPNIRDAYQEWSETGEIRLR